MWQGSGINLIYLISMFCRCSNLNNLSSKTNFKTIIKKIFLIYRSKLIDAPYYKQINTLRNLFTNRLTFYTKRQLNSATVSYGLYLKGFFHNISPCLHFKYYYCWNATGIKIIISTCYAKLNFYWWHSCVLSWSIWYNWIHKKEAN